MPFHERLEALRQMTRADSLRARLILLVAVVALPLSILAVGAVRQAYEIASARLEDQILAKARLLALLVDREFERVEAGLRVLGASSALRRGDLQALETEMRALSAVLGDTTVALAGPDGRVLLSTAWQPGEQRASASMAAVAHAALDSGRTQVGNLMPGEEPGSPSVTVAVPVTMERPATAVILAILPPDRLCAVLREGGDGIGPDRVATLLDRTGAVVASSPSEHAWIGRRVHPTFLSHLAEESEGMIGNARTLEGRPATFAFTHAHRSGYAIALSAPDAVFRVPLWEAFGQVATTSFLLLLAGGAVAVLLARRIRQELRRLAPRAAPEDAPGSTGPTLREVEELAEALAAAAAERDAAMARLAEGERRYRALAEAGALVVWRGSISGAILGSQGWKELTGQSDEELRGDGWLAMLHPEDRAGTVAAWAAARAGHAPADVEFRIHTADGAWRWVRARGVPVPSDDGPPVEWVGVIEDVDERRRAAQAVAEREQRLRLAVEAARLSTWEYDVVRDVGSRRGRPDEAFAAPTSPEFGFEDWLSRIHPEDRPEVRSRFDALVAGYAAMFAAEFRVCRHPPVMGWSWIASYGAASERDPLTGRARRVAGVAQDITERREAEQRRALLAREVDHRAKNTLAVVQSVLRLARRDEPAAFIASVEQRVAALSRVHTLLADGGWVSAELRAVAERELASFPPGTVCLEGEPVALVSLAVQPLAMVLHELATNAAKHGALSAPGGRVILSWRLEGQELHLRWQEEGGPPVLAPPGRRGFGSRVIDTTVRGQLGGRLVMLWQQQGLCCEIALPAARVLAGRIAEERAAVSRMPAPATP